MVWHTRRRNVHYESFRRTPLTSFENYRGWVAGVGGQPFSIYTTDTRGPYVSSPANANRLLWYPHFTVNPRNGVFIEGTLELSTLGSAGMDTFLAFGLNKMGSNLWGLAAGGYNTGSYVLRLANGTYTETWRGPFGTNNYASGDRIRVEVLGGRVRYYRGGFLVFDTDLGPTYGLNNVPSCAFGVFIYAASTGWRDVLFGALPDAPPLTYYDEFTGHKRTTDENWTRNDFWWTPTPAKPSAAKPWRRYAPLLVR